MIQYLKWNTISQLILSNNEKVEYHIKMKIINLS